MYLLAEVFFYAGQRSSLPQVGYRPDAVFDNAGNYWGITFVELQADRLLEWAFKGAGQPTHDMR